MNKPVIQQVMNALRWIVISDTATYGLTEVLALLEIIELPTSLVLLLRLVINITVFAIAKYRESQSNVVDTSDDE